MKTVSTAEVTTTEETASELPERVKEALGELAGAAKEGLMALSVGVGLGVLCELMEAEVEEVVGPKGRHDPERSANRHGHEPASVTLGARRVGVSRPRVRSADEKREVALATFGHFAARDPLSDAVLERMLAGVSTRRFPAPRSRSGHRSRAPSARRRSRRSRAPSSPARLRPWPRS